MWCSGFKLECVTILRFSLSLWASNWDTSLDRAELISYIRYEAATKKRQAKNLGNLSAKHIFGTDSIGVWLWQST